VLLKVFLGRGDELDGSKLIPADRISLVSGLLEESTLPALLKSGDDVANEPTLYQALATPN